VQTAQAPRTVASSGEAVMLLDGRSLDRWKPVGDPQMLLLRDGSVANQRGKGLIYYAERPFGDFTLELDYLPESAGAAAGVLLRLPQAPASLDAAMKAAYEVKLGEDPKPPAWREPVYYTRSMFVTGAINLAGTADSVHHEDQMSPNRPVNRALGEWNQLRVEAVGQRYTVYVNGEKVNDFFGRQATQGYIGLVNHTPEFSVRFRNVRVTPRTVANAPKSLGELFAVRDQRAPIRVLLVTTTHGFRHTYGIQGSIELMKELERTTEFRVDTTENLANLNPANLAKYDLLFFANSTLRVAPKDTTPASLRAVRRGHGARGARRLVRVGRVPRDGRWRVVRVASLDQAPARRQRGEVPRRGAAPRRQLLDPRGVLHPGPQPAGDEPRAAVAGQRVAGRAQHGPSARADEQRPRGVVDADARPGACLRDDPGTLSRHLASAGVRAAPAHRDAHRRGPASRRRYRRRVSPQARHGADVIPRIAGLPRGAARAERDGAARA
jgi:hypothetical protein